MGHRGIWAPRKAGILQSRRDLGQVSLLPPSRQTLPLQWTPGQCAALQTAPETGLGLSRKHRQEPPNTDKEPHAAGWGPGQEANCLLQLPVWLQLGLSEKLRQGCLPKQGT